MSSPDRFVSLDGLRGVAAIAVMLFHAAAMTMPGGYLAVDFFFCLSGFVIALAFGDRIEGGMPFGTFIRLRLARLYPMMFVGGLLGIVLHGGAASILVLIPDFRSESLFPSNPPFWSLLAEMLANIAFALFLIRLSTRQLLAIVAICGAAIFAAILSGPWPRDLGSNWGSLPWMLPRTLYPFGLGIILFRWHRQANPVRRTSGWALLMPLALLTMMATGPASRAMWDAFALLIVSPAVVWLGTRFEMPFEQFWKQMGALSYPLYCIHMPIIYFISDDVGTRLATAAVLIVTALALDHLYDRPFRAWLARAPMSASSLWSGAEGEGHRRGHQTARGSEHL